MTQKSLSLDDLKELLRTLLCQSCGIVTKRYVVGVDVGQGDGFFRLSIVTNSKPPKAKNLQKKIKIF